MSRSGVCQMETVRQILPYNDRLESRALTAIRVVVFHCTELPTLEMAREVALKEIYPSGTGNSGHFYVDRDGTVYQYVDLERAAHHVRNLNRDSVGIEVVNTGRFPDWHHWQNQRFTEPYTEAQYLACEDLLGELHSRLPQLDRIERHSDLDLGMVQAKDRPDRPDRLVRRKLDPGPLFDWDRMQAFWERLRAT